MNPQTRNTLIALGIFGVIALIVGGGFGIWYLNRVLALSPFGKHVNEYGAAFAPAGAGGVGGPAGAPQAFAGQGYVIGKVIPVDMKGSKSIDWIYFDMPNDLRAKKPDEVGTVAQLSWSEDKIDEYTDGAGAYVHVCKVDVIDLGKKSVVVSQTFRGGEPPMEKSHSGSAYGSKPTQDIVNWLKNMPRR